MEELYDKNSYPIYPGDVLKVFHFIAARRRERMYMYKLVVEMNGKLMGVSIHDIPRLGYNEAHNYPLKWNTKDGRLEDSEIVEGYGPDGLHCWRDRPKRK